LSRDFYWSIKRNLKRRINSRLTARQPLYSGIGGLLKHAHQRYPPNRRGD